MDSTPRMRTLAPFSCVTPSPPAPEASAPADRAHWFAREVQPHEAELRGYLRHRFPGVDADDVVQESYLKLLRLDAASRIESAKAYLFSVARNTASKLLLRRRRLYSDTPVNQLPDWRILDGGPDAADTANAQQRLALMAAAIDRLPPRCREIVRLSTVQGLSNAEIAGTLGLSEATVRVQMARGIKKCAVFLRESGELP